MLLTSLATQSGLSDRFVLTMNSFIGSVVFAQCQANLLFIELQCIDFCRVLSGQRRLGRGRWRLRSCTTTLHHLVTFAYQFQLLFCDICYWNRTWIFSMLRSIADAIAKQSVLFVLVDDFFPHCKHDEVHLWWLLCHFNAQHNEHLNEDMHKDGLVSLWFFLSILLHWKQKNRQFVCWNVRWRETFRLYWWIIVMIVGKNRIVFRHRNEKAIFIERPRCLGVTEVN